MKTATHLVLVAALSLAAASAAAAQESWVGKTIIVKKYGIKIGNTGDDGQQVYVGKLTQLDYKVLGDKDGWLQVNDGRGNTGWFDKDDAVLLADAVGFFTERIRQNPKDASAYNDRAVAWRLKGELDIAIKDFGEALRLDPTAAKYNNRGGAWAAKKEYEKAIADYNEAIRLDPKFAFAYNNRAMAWEDKRNFDKAVADYNEAIRLDPKYAIAYNNRGAAWADKKDYDKAIADYNEAIRLDPKDANAYNRRGAAWADKKDYDKAIADYNEAIRLDPKYTSPYYNKVCVYALQGKKDMALDYLQKTLDLGYSDFAHMAKDTDLDSIRNEPRYKELLKKYMK